MLDVDELPLRLPSFLLKADVYGLSYRRLHEVNVADDLGSEDVADMTVKLTTTKALYNTHTGNEVFRFN